MVTIGRLVPAHTNTHTTNSYASWMRYPFPLKKGKINFNFICVVLLRMHRSFICTTDIYMAEKVPLAVCVFVFSLIVYELCAFQVTLCFVFDGNIVRAISLASSCMRRAPCTRADFECNPV